VAIHGTERDAERRHNMIKTDIMSMGMRIEQIEARINSLNQRLDELGQPGLLDERFGIWPRLDGLDA
jgi:chromosome segregation ATPase